jgi:hypothetical protein
MEKVFWTMRNGEKIDIDEMDVYHLRNSLKLVARAIENQKKTNQKQIKNKSIGNIENNFREQLIQEDYFDDCYEEY